MIDAVYFCQPLPCTAIHGSTVSCQLHTRHTNSKFTKAKLLPKKGDSYGMFVKLHKEAKTHNSKFTTAKLLPKKRDRYDMFMKLHKEAKVLSVFKSSSGALHMVVVDDTCLTVRIKKKFIIFTTKCTYRTHIDKVTRFPNLENVYCLIAKRHNGQ